MIRTIFTVTLLMAIEPLLIVLFNAIAIIAVFKLLPYLLGMIFSL